MTDWIFSPVVLTFPELLIDGPIQRLALRVWLFSFGIMPFEGHPGCCFLSIALSVKKKCGKIHNFTILTIFKGTVPWH